MSRGEVVVVVVDVIDGWLSIGCRFTSVRGVSLTSMRASERAPLQVSDSKPREEQIVQARNNLYRKDINYRSRRRSGERREGCRERKVAVAA